LARFLTTCGRGIWPSKVRLLAATEANVRIHIRRGIIQIQREATIVRPIIPIATADRGAFLI